MNYEARKQLAAQLVLTATEATERVRPVVLHTWQLPGSPVRSRFRKATIAIRHYAHHEPGVQEALDNAGLPKQVGKALLAWAALPAFKRREKRSRMHSLLISALKKPEAREGR